MAQDVFSFLRARYVEASVQQAEQKNGEIHIVKDGNADYAYRYFDVDPVDLADEDAVRGKLLTPLKAWIEGP